MDDIKSYDDFINEDLDSQEVKTIWAMGLTPWLKTTKNRYFPGQTFDNVEVNNSQVSFKINSTNFNITLIGNFKLDTIMITSEGFKIRRKSNPPTLKDSIKVIDMMIKKQLGKYGKII